MSYMPQITKLIKTKKSGDIAIASWVIWLLASTSYVIYSFIVADFMLIVSCMIEFILNSIILILTVRYRNNK